MGGGRKQGFLPLTHLAAYHPPPPRPPTPIPFLLLLTHVTVRPLFLLLTHLALFGPLPSALLPALHPPCYFHDAPPPGSQRLFDLVRVKEPALRLAFWYALRNTLVVPDMDSASR